MQLTKPAVGGVPPLARLGGSPPGKFSETNPYFLQSEGFRDHFHSIFKSILQSEIIFMRFSKAIFLLKILQKSFTFASFGVSIERFSSKSVIRHISYLVNIFFFFFFYSDIRNGYYSIQASTLPRWSSGMSALSLRQYLNLN